ncbi:MAG: AI-2E family transporter [Treponema sp.]|nr:AI-2E family transporter [Treponema sp.]
MNKIFKTFHSGRAVFFMMVFICIVIAITVLKLAATVILPLTIAVLLAFVMFPLIKGLDKIHCPRIISILLVITIILSGMYLFGIMLFQSAKMIAVQMPNYEKRFQEIYNWAARIFELPNDGHLSIWQNLWGQEAIRTFVRDFTISSSNTFLRFLSSLVLVFLFIVFILLEAGFFRTKLITAFENRIERIDNMGNEIISQVTRYLTAKFLISLANGVIFAVGFSIVGLEFAIVWGVIQFLLNFIPTLGSIAAGVIISLFALLQFWPEPGPVIIVVAIILGVNLLCNIFDPKIIGDHVGISPLVILVSLLIWGYIWGFAGMVIAVPMMVIIKIISENIPMMEPVSILIGSKKSVLAKKAADEKTEN